MPFSTGFVNDLCRTESLAGRYVTMMDIDAEHVAAMQKLAVRYTDELGVNTTFEATTDHLAALQDADFEGCTLMTRETGIEVCGLCHGHYGYRDIAKTIGIDPINW